MEASGISVRTVAVSAILLVAGVGLRGDAGQQPPASQPQQPPQQQQAPPPAPPGPPQFRAGINFVRVDAIVSDKQGNAVGDMQASDFEVTEDNKPQKIETFKLVKLDGGAAAAADGPPRAIRTDFDEETEAAKDDVRLFAIFLDDYHVRRGTSLATREPLSRFVERQLGPTDMVGVMYPLESVSSVRMTRNHEAVMKGLQQFIGRKFEYTPKNPAEDLYANYPAETVEQIRNQVSLSAIRSLIVHLGSLKEGRKALILVSEGYTTMLPPQLRDPIASMPGYGNPNRGNPTAGVGDVNEERANFFGSVDMLSDLREIYDTANHYNVSIYAVDPRGLANFEYDINEGVGLETDRAYLQSTMDTLRVLSDQTDGRAIVNRNDLDAGMKQIVKDSAAYYLLGYSSTLAPSDGKFHEIKVRVKRPGVQVRARKGYWALTAEETAHALAPPAPGLPKPIEEALASIEHPSRARVIRTWIGTSRGENGKTKVTFVWEPVPNAPGERAREEPSRVSVTAVGTDGAPYFRGRVPDVALASASPASSMAAGGSGTTGATGSASPPRPPSRVSFDAQPGKMQLRLSVEGGAAQVLDSEIRELTVPDLTSVQTTLGTPEVFRARTVREFQQLKADPDAVPMAGREFSRTNRLLIRLPAYGPANSAPALTARLLNRAGQPMNDVAVAPSPAAAGEQQIELPLAGLAPAEYILEIKATGEGGDAKELIGFPRHGVSRMRAVFAIATAAIAAVPAVMPAQPAAKPRVSVVRADVIASDLRGRPVENLQPADFEVTENGVPQTLDAVRFVKVVAAPQTDEAAPIRSEFDEQEQAGRDNTRLVAILLDEYHVDASATARVREALTRFVDQQFGPRDLVTVLKPLDSLLTIRMTRDRDQIRHAIDTFQGRRGAYEPRNAFEQNFIAGAPARIEQVRTQVATSALSALVVHLGRLTDGRKTVVLVSEGLSRATRRRGLDLPTIDAVIRSANRYNVSIYPVDPVGTAAPAAGDEASPDVDTLRALADNTDGHALVDGRNLDGGFQQMVDDSSAYYLLSYRSAHPDDGKFEEVQVRVKRPAVQVRARKGYWALWPDEAFVVDMLARGTAPPASRLPPAFDVPRRTSPLVRPWLGLSRGEAGKVRVTFVWEPVARVPGDRSRVGAPARVELKVLAADGTQAFDGTVLPATGSAFGGVADPATARAVFDVPPGQLRLVMSIEDAGAQQIDTDARDVSIRDLKGPVALGTAGFLRTRTAREFRAVDADPAAVPVASREFSRTERLIVRFPAYAQGGPPRVSARLLGRMGGLLKALPVESPRTPGGLFQIDLPLAAFAPGEYFLELAASSPAGDAKDLLGFRVTN